MTNDSEQDVRIRAMTDFLESRAAEGFKIETQTGTHAIIVSPRRLSDFLGLRNRGHSRRQVVSVDEDGVVLTRAAEPIRW